MLKVFKFDDAFRSELKGNKLLLFVTFCCFLFGTSAPAFSMPFLFPEVIEEFGWSREQAALLASSKYASGAAASLLVGRLVDRTGGWIALMLLVMLGGSAMVSCLWVDGLNSYYLVGVLLGVCGSGATVAIQVMLSRGFNEYQGTAIGIAMLGTSLGSVAWPLLGAAAIDGFGWRMGFAMLSSAIWIVVLPLLLVGAWRSPRARAPERAGLRAENPGAKAASIWPIVKSWPFWALAIALFLTALVDQGFIQHQVLMFGDAGLSKQLIAAGVSLVGVISFLGRIFVGNLLDAHSNKSLSWLYFSLSVCALLSLWISNPFVFVLFITLRAIAHTAIVLDSPVMTKHVFGPSHVGTLLGMFSAFVYAGFATGPWIMGRIYDVAGSYGPAFVMFAILPLMASALVWTLKPVFWWKARQDQGLPPQPVDA